MLRRFQCWRHGHQWVNIAITALAYGAMEYTDRCSHCRKIRNEVVVEH